MLFTVTDVLATELALIPADASLERERFQFFVNYTAKEVPGPPEFWRQLLCASSYQPAIRNALIAMSFLHEKVLRTVHAAFDTSVIVAMVEHYGRAIRYITRMSEDSRDIRVVLVICLIISMFESAEGRVNLALAHIIQGVRVLKQVEATREGSGADSQQHLVDIGLLSLMVTQLERISTIVVVLAFKRHCIDMLSPPQLPFDTLTGAESHLCAIKTTSCSDITLQSPTLPRPTAVKYSLAYSADFGIGSTHLADSLSATSTL
ncbi:hypothetical protein H2203_001324 [Taxawa tesnikishii (nom. ined.)]|nr:hypothetical protein H2203_001324 [Dothideales sp. JES 119]